MNGLVLLVVLVPLLVWCSYFLAGETRWSDDVVRSVRFWRDLDRLDDSGDRR